MGALFRTGLRATDEPALVIAALDEQIADAETSAALHEHACSRDRRKPGPSPASTDEGVHHA